MFIVAEKIDDYDINKGYKISFSNWYAVRDGYKVEIQIGGNKSKNFLVEDLHTEALLALFDYVPMKIDDKYPYNHYRNSLNIIRFVKQIADWVEIREYDYRIYGLDGVLK